MKDHVTSPLSAYTATDCCFYATAACAEKELMGSAAVTAGMEYCPGYGSSSHRHCPIGQKCIRVSKGYLRVSKGCLGVSEGCPGVCKGCIFMYYYLTVSIHIIVAVPDVRGQGGQGRLPRSVMWLW